MTGIKLLEKYMQKRKNPFTRESKRTMPWTMQTWSLKEIFWKPCWDVKWPPARFRHGWSSGPIHSNASDKCSFTCMWSSVWTWSQISMSLGGWLFMAMRKRMMEMMMVVVADSLNLHQIRVFLYYIHIFAVILIHTSIGGMNPSIRQATIIILIPTIITSISVSFVLPAQPNKSPVSFVYLELFLAPGSMPWKVVVVVMSRGWCGR